MSISTTSTVVPARGAASAHRTDPWPIRWAIPGPATSRPRLIAQLDSSRASTAPTTRTQTRERGTAVIGPVQATAARRGRGGVPRGPGPETFRALAGALRKGRKLTDPPHECGGSGTTGVIWSRTLQVGLGGWRLRGLHREAGGLPPDVVSSLHVLPLSERDSGNRPGFYVSAGHEAFSRLKCGQEGPESRLELASADTRGKVKTFKFATACSMLHPELGDRHHTGRL